MTNTQQPNVWRMNRTELVHEVVRLREALAKVAKVHGSADKVACIVALDAVAKLARETLGEAP